MAADLCILGCLGMFLLKRMHIIFSGDTFEVLESLMTPAPKMFGKVVKSFCCSLSHETMIFSFSFQRECNDLVELFTKTNMTRYHHSVQDLVSQVTFKKVESMFQVCGIYQFLCVVIHSGAQMCSN